jgi:surface antigen
MKNIFVSIVAATAMLGGVLLTPAVAGPYGGAYGPVRAYDDSYGRNPDGYRYRGCSRDRTVGTIIGGILGGIIGNNLGRGRGRGAATVAGIIFGGIAGNAIARGACRDREADAYYYNEAYYDAFDEPDYGRRYDWRNPYSGNHGFVVPTRDYDDGYRYGYRGGECREFEQTVWIDGHRTQAYGTACRNRDGSWRIVNY